MLLNWRKQPDPPDTPEKPADRPVSPVMSDADVGDRALDSVASLLRVYAQYPAGLNASDTDTLQHDCEAWARHVLTCSPPPGSEAESVGRRDWGGLRGFFQAVRKKESERVMKSLADLRQAIWTFVDGLKTAMTQDQDIDDRVSEQLDHLRTAVTSSSTEDLPRAVMSAVSTLTELVEERRRRQEERVSQLGKKVSDLSEELLEVRKESTLDDLTKLFTRKPFEDYLTKAAYLRNVFDQPCCLLMIDLDRFKEINDNYGHPVGDAALKTLADCLVRNFPRRSDLVARYGGDEFAVILSGATLAEAERLAERLVESIRSSSASNMETPVMMTVSVGVAEVARGETAESWLARADAELYEAKRAGRDRVSASPSPIARAS